MFLYTKWLSLSLPSRMKIAKDFGIEKKGSTEVFNNTVKSDGFLIKDIEGILTLSAIQKYLGINETDFQIVWELLIDKIENRVSNPRMSVLPKEEVAQFNKEYEDRNPGKVAPVPGVEPKKVTRGRSKKTI